MNITTTINITQTKGPITATVDFSIKPDALRKMTTEFNWSETVHLKNLDITAEEIVKKAKDAFKQRLSLIIENL